MKTLYSSDKLVLFLLIIAHLPNKYIAILIIDIVCFLDIINPKLKFPKIVKRIWIYFILLLMIMIFSFLIHFSSINNILWSIFNFSPLIAVPLLLYKQHYNFSQDRLISSVKIFTIIQLCFMTVQYLNIAFQRGSLNIYSTSSGAGDLIAGTLLNFAPPLVVTFSFIFLLFFYNIFIQKKKNMKFLLLTGLMIMLPGMISGIGVLIIAVISAIIILLIKHLVKLKISKLNIKLLGITIFGVFSLYLIQFQNILYGFRLISLAIASQAFIKIKLIFNTYELLFSNPIITLFGVGGGNYSSRAAFMVSGEYLSYQPSFIPVTPSKFMLEYILSIWDRATYNSIVGGSAGNSMVNEPFIEYCSIAGEAGLIGFILLIIVLLELVIFGLRFNNHLLLLGGIYISLILFTNNWFSFPSFALMMWLVIKFAISNKQVKNAKI